jgi:hypothetical protein
MPRLGEAVQPAHAERVQPWWRQGQAAEPGPTPALEPAPAPELPARRGSNGPAIDPEPAHGLFMVSARQPQSARAAGHAGGLDKVRNDECGFLLPCSKAVPRQRLRR